MSADPSYDPSADTETTVTIAEVAQALIAVAPDRRDWVDALAELHKRHRASGVGVANRIECGRYCDRFNGSIVRAARWTGDWAAFTTALEHLDLRTQTIERIGLNGDGTVGYFGPDYDPNDMDTAGRLPVGHWLAWVNGTPVGFDDGRFRSRFPVKAE